MKLSPLVLVNLAWCVLFVPMSAIAAPAESPASRIAILDFQDGTSGKATPAEILSLSDLVRGVARDVLPTGRYLLMTRENIQQMLPPGQSLVDCLGECAVETGRKLGADYVVTGEVALFGGQLRVTLKLHETRLGDLVGSARAGAPDLLGIERDLTAKAQNLLLKLRVPAPDGGGEAARNVQQSQPSPEAWTAQGTARVVVSFASDPPGAIVEIDGQPVGETPCKRALATGVYRLGLKKVRYVAHEQSLEVRAGAATNVSVALTPDFGWLAVESEPSGLTVTVDGEDWGRTPVTAREVATGAHEVELGSPNHHPAQRTVAIARGQRELLRLSPVPRNGGLMIAAVDAKGNAAEGRVLVDGRDVGAVYEPLTVLQGRREVVVNGAAGSWKGSAAIVEGQMQEMSVTLSAAASSTVIRLVEIQAGSFVMGSPASETGRSSDETQHRVQITRAYLMSATEVTQAQWEQVMGSNRSRHKGASLPVERVTWHDAVSFCNKLSTKEGLLSAYRISGDDTTWDPSADGYRLPTEAEWEYACRAGTTTAYNTGSGESALGSAGWYGGNSRGETRPVGQKAANAWGLHDMHGNVWEWCWDKSAEYGGGSTVDPRGPASGSYRVLRGGGLNSLASYCRSAIRGTYAASDADGDLGFRVVRNSAR